MRKNVTLEQIYKASRNELLSDFERKKGVQEVAELDADNWENVRGPRDNEDNVQYKQAV